MKDHVLNKRVPQTRHPFIEYEPFEALINPYHDEKEEKRDF